MSAFSWDPALDGIKINSSYCLREAEISDVIGLADLLMSSFYPSNPWNQWLSPLLKIGISTDIRHRLKSTTGNYRCFVCTKVRDDTGAIQKEPDSILGTVEISRRPLSFWPPFQAKQPYISNLAVTKSYRNQGIAQALLALCEKAAQDWDGKYMYLHVLAGNREARSLYEKLGYRPYPFYKWLYTPSLPIGWGGTKLLMVKSIKP